MIKKKNQIPKPTHFGKNLKYLRRLNGLSQKALAADLEISRNNIASYESGVVEPNATTFLKSCEYFKTLPAVFMSQILSDEGVDTSLGINYTDMDTLDQYISDQMEIFVAQTNETTKVLEGYIALGKIKTSSKPSTSIMMQTSFDDLLDLLHSLITVNWDFIQAVLPSKARSDK